MQDKEENNTKLIHRLSVYITESGTTFNKLAIELGLSNSYFSKMLKKGGSIGSDIIENILRMHPDINADWLLTGRGLMFANETLSSLPASYTDASLIYKIYKEEQERMANQLREKDARIKELTGQMLQMAEEIGRMKEQVKDRELESLNVEQPVENAIIKNRLCKQTMPVDSANARSQE